MNTLDFLSISSAICPDRDCVLFEGKRYTFSQVNDRSNRLANSMAKLGVKKGDMVAMLQVNCSQFLESYYAVAKLGAILVPLNFRAKEDELTYMLIDASELQTVSLDTGARVHENSPDEYLERIAEVYINGSPLPQLFSDQIYIDTLQRHYDTTLEDARNYSIVGCVEPCASDDHFRNTDCANLNLSQPFLQALKGQKHHLWRFESS